MSLYPVAHEIYRLELALTVLVGKVVEGNAAVGKYRADTKRTFFAALSRHDLRAKSELHLRSGPYYGLYRIILLFIKHPYQGPLGPVSFYVSPCVGSGGSVPRGDRRRIFGN